MNRLLILVSLVTGCGGWTKTDTLMELGFAAATAADWQQTRAITRDCDEQNMVMGACGQQVPVAAYFPTMIVAHAAIAALLPPHWRTVWQGVATGAEVNQVWRNQLNGYTLDGGSPPIIYERRR